MHQGVLSCCEKALGSKTDFKKRVPPPPAKAPWHMSEQSDEWVEKRRNELEKYMRLVLKAPDVLAARNPFVLQVRGALL